MNRKSYITVLITTLILGIITFSNAQTNIVPDPGFELWDSTNVFSLTGSPDWYAVSGSPDLHRINFPNSNLSGLSPCPLAEGNTNCGYPYAGDAVVGAWKENGATGTREWAACQLITPMVEGNCYEVSFFIQNKEDNPSNLFETNQWGIYFSETPNPFFSANLADYSNKLQHIVMTEEVVGDTIWHFYEFDYQAAGDYEYLYLGYMGDVSTSTYTAANEVASIGFYAWFDEISVVDVTPQLSVSLDTIICQGDSILITADSNYPVSWSHLAGDTTSSFWAYPSQDVTYHIMTLDSTVCTKFDSVTITFNETTVNEFSDLICPGATPFILSSSGINGTWSGTGIENTNTGLFNPDLTGIGATEVYFESSNHCIEDFTLMIEVSAAPEIVFEADNSIGCPPLDVTFVNQSPTTGTSYTWDLGDGNMSSNLNPVSHTYVGSGDYDISLSITYSDYCTATLAQAEMVTVGEYPVANFEFSPNAPSNVRPEVLFTNTSDGNIVHWSWDFAGLGSSSSPNPGFEFNEPGDYPVSLEVSTAEGCTGSITKIVPVANKVNLFIPNAFSPNFDGINDYFEIFANGNMKSLKITIFDRWGAVVYNSNDRNFRWDGRMNGKLVNKGVYTYVLEYDYSTFGLTPQIKSTIISGDITIMASYQK